MKKFLSTAALVVFVGTFVLCGTSRAEEPAKPLKIIEKETGKIESITKPDPAKGQNGSFTIIASTGKKEDFYLLPRTKLYTAASAPLTFEQLKKGDKVTVLYVISLKGMNDAISVTQGK